MGDIDNIELFEKRLASFERLVGKSDKHDNAQIWDLLSEINQKISSKIPQIRLYSVLQHSDDIKKYASLDFFNELPNDQQAKLELILREEEQLIEINKNFEKLETLSKVLTSDAFNEVPKMIEKLQELSLKHSLFKEEMNAYTNETKEFLAFYFHTVS
jgi:hypothetical protein